jgi:hypothetical protein
MNHVIDVKYHGAGQPTGQPLQERGTDGTHMEMDKNTVSPCNAWQQKKTTDYGLQDTISLEDGMAMLV